MITKTTLSECNLCRFPKALLFFLFLYLSTTSLSAQGGTFTSWTALKDAVNASTTGGTYYFTNASNTSFSTVVSGTFTNSRANPESNPIIIKPKDGVTITFTGSSTVPFKTSSYITLEGFIFNCAGSQTLVKLEGCNNMRITRNVFELAQTSSAKWILIGGVYDDLVYPYNNPSHHNRIDHNTFQNKTLPGHYITIDGNNKVDQSQYDRIDHNYFKNNDPRATNEQESVRIGWSDMSKSSGFTTVEFNLFENCNGDPEIVSVKSSDNIVRHNTFRSSYGTLSLRHGNRNRLEGNYFFGEGKPIGNAPAPNEATLLYTGGIRIYGKDHVIINNYMEGLNGTKWDAPITITQGDAEEGNSSLSKHFIADNVTIAYNTLVNNDHGIEIGFSNKGDYSKQVKDVKIMNNLITGSKNSLVEIIDSKDQGSKITWANNLMYPTGSAALITGATNAATINAFADVTKVKNENPFLTFDATAGVWKSTAQTPLYANAVTTAAIVDDIEGQSRPTTNNPGADHFSLESIRYKPLTPADVGPNAYEVDDTSESLYVSTVTEYIAAGESKDISITSNVTWSATTTDTWITVTSGTGSNNGTFSVSVPAYTGTTTRTGTVTVVGGTLTRVINITQAAPPPPDPRDGLTKINPNAADVEVFSFCNEEVYGTTKLNYAINSLDKDLDTQWSGSYAVAPCVDNKLFIIYDLKGAFDLSLVDIATTSGKTYKLQIWVSSTGTEDADFSNPFSPEDLLSNQDASFKAFVLPASAVGTKYVKIIGSGQVENTSSKFTSIHEIEFYGEVSGTAGVDGFELAKYVQVFPNPAKDILKIKLLNTGVKTINMFDIIGRILLQKNVKAGDSEVPIDVANYSNGVYFINFLGENGLNLSKRIVIAH